MNLRTLAKQSSLYLLGSLASRAVGFFMVPVYAHYLNPAEYGTVELIDLCIQIAAISLGIQAIGGAMIRIYYDYADEEGRHTVVSIAMLGTLALGILVAGSACLLAGPSSSLLFKSGQQAWLIRSAFIAMMFGNLGEIALLYFRLRDRVGFVVAYTLVQLIISLGLNIYFIAIAHLGVWGFVISRLITACVGGTFLTALAFREVGFRWRLEPARKLGLFALPLILTGISTFVIHFSDRFFINQMKTLNEVGIYSLAYKVGFLVSYIVGEPFGRVWNVKVYEQEVSADGWRQQAGRTATYLTFCLFLVGLCLCVFIGPILGLLAEPAFARAAELVPLLVLGYVVREMGDFFKAMLYINKRTYLVTRITAVCAVLNFALNWFLIERWGMAGAAWATLITWFAYMVLCWVPAQREHRICFGARAFGQVLAIAVVLFSQTRVRLDQPALVLYLRDALVLVAFCVLLAVSRYFPRGDWGMIVGYMSRLRLKTQRAQ